MSLTEKIGSTTPGETLIFHEDQEHSPNLNVTLSESERTLGLRLHEQEDVKTF